MDTFMLLNKVSVDQYHVTMSPAQVFFFKLAADHVQIFDWMTGSCQVNL